MDACRAFSRLGTCYDVGKPETKPLMAILKSASIEVLKRLLELFPAAKLRENWSEIKGKKEVLSDAVAKQCHRDELVKFVDDNLSCCKQHVYIFSRAKPLKELPEMKIGDAERVLGVGGKPALYLISMKYKVILSQPLEETSLEFLWPFRLDIMRGCLIVRFVVLENNISSHFHGRPSYIAGRNVEEQSILQQVTNSFVGNLNPVDLHKGIKKLWKNGFVDATRTRYKKPTSTAAEAMDKQKGIKKNDPELYKTVLKSPLFKTLFQIQSEKGSTVSVFWADPSAGSLSFPRYSKRRGDTDYVIDEILRNN